jgi:acyl-CoA thioesterase
VKVNVGDIPPIAFLETLGIELTEIGERHAVMTVTVDDRHLNYRGGAHGGLLAALADTVCFFPRPLLPSGCQLATVSLNMSYLKPAALGDCLMARSELLHLGRRTVSLVVRIHNQNHQLLAHGSAILMIL